MTSAALLNQLRRHYLPEGRQPAGIFAPEIEAPATNRRADLIWVGVTRAGRELVGHEIKVSRADLLAELADLAKSDPWQRYCDRWWLVVPHAALLAGLTVPPSWGVLTPPAGRRTRSMTVHTPAPKLTPDEQGPALRTLATWLHWRLHQAHNQHAQTTKGLEHVTRDRDELRLQVPRESLDTALEVELVHRIVRELGGTHYPDRIGSWQAHVSVDDVVATLRDLGEAHARLDGVLRQIRYGRDRLRDLATGAQQVLVEDDAKAAPA